MKTIVITGTSRGVGFALAQQAAAAGHKVFAISRNTEKLKRSANLIPVSLDISDDKAVASWIHEFKKDELQVDALINNAGTLENISFEETVSETFKKIYSVNVFGLASITRQLLPHISSKGHVVNISSMGGVQNTSKFPGLAAYSSSKGAVNILTELLAEEYKKTGPAFNALALGAVQTEMLEAAFPGYKAPVSAGTMAKYILQFALGGHLLYNGKILPVSLETP